MSDIKFEQALEKLEKIVEALETGELGLDESLGKYEEGIALARLCQSKLAQAKKKIEILVKSKDGTYQAKDLAEDEKPKKKKAKKEEDIVPKDEEDGLF